MERRFNRNLPMEGRGGSISLQKQLVENQRNRADSAPDLTDFMNDMFFGTANSEKKTYNLTGTGGVFPDEDDFDSSRRSVSSRSTREWLEEAKRMVAQSPSRCESPGRLTGSPRFAASRSNFSTGSIDKRDPLSRSARRNRSPQSFSGEILSKAAKNNHNKSEDTLESQVAEASPPSTLQKWFSNILNPQNNHIPNPNPNQPTISPEPKSPKFINNQDVPQFPPRQSIQRKSRFQNSPNAAQSHPIPTPANQPTSKRTFKSAGPHTIATTNSATLLDNQLLSPPKHLIESSHRRSISSSTCSVPDSQVLSPPKNSVDTAHRRSVSEPLRSPETIPVKCNEDKERHAVDSTNQDLNEFLKKQKVKIGKIMSGEINGKAKIVLSGPTDS